MRNRLRELGYKFADTELDQLVRLLAGAQEHRYKVKSSPHKEVTRSTALVVLDRLNPIISASLRAADLDWDGYCRKIHLGEEDEWSDRLVDDVDLHEDFDTALARFAEKRAPNKPIPTPENLALAIIEMVAEEPSSGKLGRRLKELGVSDLQKLPQVLKEAGTRSPRGPVKVFISYSSLDRDYHNELIQHLRPLQDDGLITVFSDRSLIAGERWAERLAAELAEARIVLFLVSHNFLQASGALAEVEAVLARADWVVAIPIMLEPVELRSTPLARFYALPTGAVPITEWRPREAAYEDVVDGLTKAALRLQESVPGPDPRSEPLSESLGRDNDQDLLPDTVSYNRDDPAVVDELGRREVAGLLWRLIREIRLPAPYAAGDAGTTPAADPGGAFVVHLHGRWGSGKTSLLRFLQDQMSVVPPPAERWIFVDFNAWQHQRVGAPWWSLMMEVCRQGAAQLRVVDAVEARRTLLWDWWWRLKSRWGPVMLAGVALLAIGLLVLLAWPGGEPQPPSGPDLETPLKTIVALLTVVGGLLAASRFLLLGSAQEAQAFLQGSRDPMERVRRHYKGLIARLKRPVAVAVDDLDRCDARYVVELLHAVQTLFRDAPVVYLVAADRDWICSSYQQIYKDYSGEIREPGRPLGHLFLEKIFQLSISVPRMSVELQKDYWRRLLGAEKPADAVPDETLQRAKRDELRNLSEVEVLAKVQAVEDRAAGPTEIRATREAALDRLSDPDLRGATEHFLTQFGHLTDPNPRSMKRLLNAYRYQRDLRVLTLGARWTRGREAASSQVSRPEPRREQLALWTIVELRWPVLADYLVQNPEIVRYIGERHLPDNLDVPEEIRTVLAAAAVREVFNGTGLRQGVSLDAAAVRAFSGQYSADPGTGAA